MIGIGKVLEYESKNKSQVDTELDISSGDDAQSDLFVPPKDSVCTLQASSVKFDLFIDPDVNAIASRLSSVTRLLLDHVPPATLQATFLPPIDQNNANTRNGITITRANDTDNQTCQYSSNLSASRSLLGYVGPIIQAPLYL